MRCIADQTALKDLSGLMVGTKSWWYDKRKARKKTRITQIKCLVRKKITSGAGLPASTLQENSAASPSFTTSFSGLTLITGLTGKIKAGYRKIVRMLVISICVTQESDAPPSLASGWGKLIKEASLCWVPPSHSGNTPVHHHGCNHYLGEQR